MEAAWQLVRYDRRWKWIFEGLAKRRGRKRAIVAVARRLLAMMLAMLKTGKAYRVVDAVSTVEWDKTSLADKPAQAITAQPLPSAVPTDKTTAKTAAPTKESLAARSGPPVKAARKAARSVASRQRRRHAVQAKRAPEFLPVGPDMEF